METNLCRVCFKTVGEFPLFKDCGDGALSEIIMSLFNIEVIFNVNLPDTICTECIENIKSACKTKESIINAEILVKTYLEKLDRISEEAENSKQINEDNVEQIKDSFQNSDDISTNSIQEDDVDQCTNLENDMTSVLPRLPELYKCDNDKCDYITSTYTQLLFHMRSHRDLNLYECERCGNEYKCKSRYTYHAAVHSNNRRFTCKICDKGFKSLANLGQHRLTHKTKRIHKCPHCEKTFCHLKGLNSHLLFHNEKNIVCNICNHKFRHSTFLKTHQAKSHNKSHKESSGRRKHLYSDKIPCEFCGKTFLKTILQKHIDMKHLEQKKPFQCSYCDMAFVRSGNLTTHMQIHIKSKDVLLDPNVKDLFKFKCDECDHIFTTSNYLKIHKIRRHSDKKQFVCLHCKKEFAFKSYLDRHIRLVHDRNNSKNFICNICGKVSLDRCALTAHMLAHSGENPFQCKLCDSKYRYGKSLRIHMAKTHNLKVDVNKYFTFRTVKVKN